MSDVTCHDDGAVEADACGDGVFGKFFADFAHGEVEVNLHGVSFACLTEFFGDEGGGVVVHFLNPHTVLVDFALDVSVSRATHSEADGATCAVAGKTDDADVVGKGFAAELCAQSNFVCLFEQFFFEFDVAEGASCFVAGGGQVVIVVCGSQLHCQQVLFGGGASDDEGDVIGRAGCSSEALHLVHEEGHERFRVQNCLGLLVEIGLVGRATAFGDAEEMIFHSFRGFDVDLCGEVAACVYLLIHGEGCIL